MVQDWKALFDHVHDQTVPAEPQAIRAVLARISTVEIADIAKSLSNPWPLSHPLHSTYKPLDPSVWRLPPHGIPESYANFLSWSDGATWQTGDREFSCFGCNELREYLLQYHFPEYMPGALPFGLDGGGIFCVFDLRQSSLDSVWAIGAGVLEWASAVKVADNLVDFCCGKRAVGKVYSEGLTAKLLPEKIRTN